MACASTRRLVVVLAAGLCLWPQAARAQSPELAMREFSSGQIKKGVRSIGFGGDGATWGNYGLVWMDASTALFDFGDTHFTNGNDFHFGAVGLTTPALWHRLAIYGIYMFQNANDVHLNLSSPGLGSGAPVAGNGTDHAVFVKAAMPLGKGVSIGVLLSHETSQFDAAAAGNPAQRVHYETEWRPSGGFGLAWQPGKRLLFGFRALLNNDFERRFDSAGLTQGMAHTYEFRLGSSVSPWQGALIDVGGTSVERKDAVNASYAHVYHPNLGFEQALLQKRLALRAGVDETSPTAGFSLKLDRFKLDAAYVENMARSRVGNLFGTHSNSILLTFTVDYRKKPPADQKKS